MELYRSFRVHDYIYGGASLAESLEEKLENLQKYGWQIVSVTPHVVYRGKPSEYLEYIIVAMVEPKDEEERKENEVS